MVFMVSLFNFSENPILKLTTNLSVLLFIGTIFFSDTIKLNKVFGYMWVFLMFCTVGIMFSSAQDDTINKVKTLFLLFMTFIAVYQYAIEEEKDVILRILSICTITNAVYIVLRGADTLDTVKRVSAITGDSNQVSAYLVFGSGVLLYMAFTNKLPKWLSVLGIALSVLAIVLQGSRGAIAAVGFMIVLETVLLMRYNRTPLTKKIVVYLSVVVFILVAVYYIMNDPILYMTLGRRLVSFYEIQTSGVSSMNEQSTSQRLYAYRLAFERFMDRPFIGWGIGSFAKFSEESLLNRNSFCPNNYLEVLQGVGIIGTVFYYMIYGNMLKNAVFAERRRVSPLSVLCVSIIAAMLIEHITVVFYYYKLEYIYLSVLLALERNFDREEV